MAIQRFRLTELRNVVPGGLRRPQPFRAAGEWPGTHPLPQWTSAEALVLVATLVGLGLRVASLGSIPPALHQDEAVNGFDAYSLWLTGRDHLGHPFPFAGLESFGDWVSPLLTFLTVPVVGLFGLRVEVIRAVPAVVGALAIPLLYYLGLELFGRRAIGVVAAWLVALSPWAIHRGHFAIPPSIVPTMVVGTLLALVWTMRRSSSIGVVLLAVVATLTVDTYPTMKLYVPLLLIAGACIYAPAVRRIDTRAFVCAALVAIVGVGPIYYLSLADPAGRARFDQVSVFSAGLANPLFLARQYMSYLSPHVLFLSGNGHPAQTPTPPGAGIEPLTTAPLLLAGLLSLAGMVIWSRRGEQRQSALVVLAALALYPIPGALTLPSPHLGRAVHVIPLLALIGGLGAVAMAICLRQLAGQSRSLARAAVVSTAVLFTLSIGAELSARYRDYFLAYPRRADVLQYFEYGLEPALRYAFTHEAEYDEIWVADTNEAYIYVLFYGRWSPGVVHNILRVQRHPPEFNEVEALGKYHFGDASGLKALHLPVVDTVVDPTGHARYEVRGGVVDAGSRRILLIEKPSATTLPP